MTTNESATSIASVTLEVADVDAAQRFYTVLGLGDQIRLSSERSPSTGFRGFALSLTVSQPANVDSYLDAAITGGAEVLKPAAKSIWGYGGVVQAPDGCIWKVATSAKKDSAPAAREFDDIILLLGVDDVKVSRQFYVDKGMAVSRSYGGKYADFASNGSTSLTLALYKRSGLAKDLGVAADGTGAHQILLSGNRGGHGVQFADPDGFQWTTTSPVAPAPTPA